MNFDNNLNNERCTFTLACPCCNKATPSAILLERLIFQTMDETKSNRLVKIKSKYELNNFQSVTIKVFFKDSWQILNKNIVFTIFFIIFQIVSKTFLWEQTLFPIISLFKLREPSGITDLEKVQILSPA